ncbi:MAG: IS110 family transposase [Sulfitobacter sp.]|nr:IS110 family transposase [Sulfitobacter sp.]
MLAELVDHVIGIDPDRDSMTAAVIDAHTTGVIASARFSADSDGYDEVIGWAEAHTVAGERLWAVEGTASYGRGVTAALARAGEWMSEFDQPEKAAAKDGAKSDELDAIRAARETLGRPQVNTPRDHDGHREAVRVHTVTRAAAVRSRTAAINELKALVVTAPDELRSELRGLRTPGLVKRCAGFRDTPGRPVAQRSVRNSMRALARRIIFLKEEIKAHDHAIKTLVDEAAPQLVAQPGIGYVTAAMLYIAWSHPGRCRNEAAYARLGGVAPVLANSGQPQDRHRLNRRGDRQLNKALYIVAMTRLRYDDETKAYRDRRRAQGKTDREINRCLKRYIARRVWRLLEHHSPETALDRT